MATPKTITTLPHLEMMQEEGLDLTNKSTLTEPLKKAIKGLNLKWNRVKLNPEKLLAAQNQLAAESAELAQAIEDEIFNNIPYRDEVPPAPVADPVPDPAPVADPIPDPTPADPAPVADPVPDPTPDPVPEPVKYGLTDAQVHELETEITQNTNPDGRVHCELVEKHIKQRPDKVVLNKISLHRVSYFIPYYQVSSL